MDPLFELTYLQGRELVGTTRGNVTNMDPLFELTYRGESLAYYWNY
jgi:hypothetical protein